MNTHFLTLTVLASALALPAQSIEPAPPADGALAAKLGADVFLTPLRSVTPDQGVGGGLWASGAAYKASFADGITFYPVLGPDAPRNQPVRWRTRDIAVGEQSLVLGVASQPQAHATDWRYELRRGAVTEAYDVRNDGVEQTFVVHARPSVLGDLVVVGDVETELVADPVAWGHQELQFRDADGQTRVRYGAAIAIDATGRRLPLDTSYDDGAIRLRVPGAWLASAAFPLVIDPLLSATTLITHLAAISGFDVARDDGNDQLMIVCRRAASGADYDGFGFLVGDGFTAVGTTVFSDIDATWSTEHLSVALVGGTNKWILALQRRFPSDNNRSYLRYRLHPAGNPTPGNDVTYVSRPGLESWVAPDVGGSLSSGSGDLALVAFRAEYPNTAPYNSDVFGILVDTASDTYGSRFSLGNALVGSTYDRGSPRVNKESGGATSSWVVAFTEINRTITNDDIDLYVVRVTPGGSVTTRAPLPSGTSDHKYAPAVDGRDGRYLLVYGRRELGHGGSWAHTLRARRFDFADNATAPTFRADTLLASGGEFYPTDVAFDSRTRSHWVATYYDSAWDVFAARMGYDAVIAETATVYDGPGSGSSPTVCFDDDTRRFHIVHPAAETLYPIRARSLVHETTSAVVQASGCGGNISANDLPLAGSEFFAVRATGLTGNTAAVLLCALTPADIPLAPQMPGCRLLLSPATLLFTLSTNADAGGTALVDLPLPTRVAGVDLYFQWAHVALGANAANLLATRRLSVPVR